MYSGDIYIPPQPSFILKEVITGLLLVFAVMLGYLGHKGQNKTLLKYGGLLTLVTVPFHLLLTFIWVRDVFTITDNGFVGVIMPFIGPLVALLGAWLILREAKTCESITSMLDDRCADPLV